MANNIDRTARSLAAGAKEYAENSTVSYVYRKDALEGIVNDKKVSIVFWGDSVTAGAGADFWYSNWVSQVSDTIQITNGSMYGRGYVAVNDSGTPSGWTLETKGTNKFRAYSSSTTLTVPAHPFTDRKIDIIYSTETDGGAFDVTVDSTIVSGTSAGAKSYGNKMTVTVPKTKQLIITPKGKTYIEGFILHSYDGKDSGTLVHKVGHGGMSAGAYSDEEITASISNFEPSLTCIGHIINDVGMQDLTLYKNKMEKACEVAMQTGKILFYIPFRGRIEEETIREVSYSEYKTVIYALSDKYNATVIDFDSYFGGYSGALKKGLLFDDVHPNQTGHDLMASLFISEIILSPTYRGLKISHSGNVGNYFDTVLDIPKYLGRFRTLGELFIGGVIRGYSETTAAESYLLANKLRVVDDGSFDFISLENYGASGSIVTLKDKTQPNILRLRNSSNLSYLLSRNTVEIDTTEADKFANYLRIRMLAVAENGLKIGTLTDTTKLPNDSFYVDAGVLKFKDSTGTSRTVTLT